MKYQSEKFGQWSSVIDFIICNDGIISSRFQHTSLQKIDEDPLKPTGIAIDHAGNKVYYVDLSNRDHILVSMNLDGSGKQKHYQVTYSSLHRDSYCYIET